MDYFAVQYQRGGEYEKDFTAYFRHVDDLKKFIADRILKYAAEEFNVEEDWIDKIMEQGVLRENHLICCQSGFVLVVGLGEINEEMRHRRGILISDLINYE